MPNASFELLADLAADRLAKARELFPMTTQFLLQAEPSWRPKTEDWHGASKPMGEGSYRSKVATAKAMFRPVWMKAGGRRRPPRL
jgi:hypothetical protein